MAALDKLAAELILMIGTHVEDQADLASLVRVCRRLYNTLDPDLYKRDVQTGSPLSLLWGSRFGLRGTLEKAHEAGANLEQAWVSHFWSIFPDISGLGNFRIDQIPTASSVTTTTKRYHVSHFKHISCFKKYPKSPVTLTPHPSVGPNDNHAPMPRTAVRNATLTYPNNFLICQELYATRQPAMMPPYWWHALDLAILFGHHDVIRYLLEKGVNVANSHSRGLCCRTDLCHGSENLQIRPRKRNDTFFSHLNRVHNPLTLAACLGDIAIQKMLLIYLGLGDMANGLSTDKVEAHGYRVDRFLEGSKEKEVLSTFMTAKAEVVEKLMSEQDLGPDEHH